MEDAPGHTVGNMLIRARSAGRCGVFSGDIFHSPIQIHYPEVNSKACDLPDMARRTRLALLEEAAEHGHLLFPGHLPDPWCCRVRRTNGGFACLPGDGSRTDHAIQR
jgi:glyoxylase-like metal-dependent hydrolase (beta-lactamase superfamily II)